MTAVLAALGSGPPELLSGPRPWAALGGVFELEPPHGADWLFLGVAAAIVLGPLVAAKVRLPGIIGLLAGGLAIGPEGLGIVTTQDTTVSGLGQVGLLYLMFSAGLELDLSLFKKYRGAAVLFGLTTFAVPLSLGFVAGRLLDYSPEASLLLGSIWASHTLVTYPIVRAAGLAGNRAVATSVGATVLTDTLALVVLAGVSGSETGDRATTAVLVSLVLGLVGLAFYGAVVLPKVTRWFFTGPAQDRAMRYSYLLVAMLSASVLAEVVGIEGIVGAFFAGLGLNRMVPAGSALMERVEFFGSALFVPVFLVSVGVLINPSVMVEPATLGLAAVFSGVVLGGKAAAAVLVRPFLGFNWSETGMMFGLTTSQAAATLAATFVGFDIGLFGEQVVNAVLVVILVSMIVAAVSTERFARRVEPTPVEPGSIGRKVVVPIARADRLESLARVARLVSSPDAGTVRPLRVNRVGQDGVDDDRTLLGVAEKVFGSDGLDVESRLRIGPDPGQAVVSAVAEDEGTVVLLDWQIASRFQPALRGSRDDNLVSELSVPVLLGAMSDVPHQRVVLAVGRYCLEPAGLEDLELGVEVARRLQGADRKLVPLTLDGDVPYLLRAATHLPTWLPDKVASILEPMVDAGQADPGSGSEASEAASGSGTSSGGPAAPGRATSTIPTWGEQLESGDMVIIPGYPEWSTFGPAALQASARRGVSVVVVANPGSWTAPEPSGRHALGVLADRRRYSSVRWP